MLNQPCSFHTPNPSKPENHSTRQCSWLARVRKEDTSLLLPPPLAGANTQIVPVRAGNRDKPEGVNPVNNSHSNAGQGQNDYKEHHQAYVVFVTEPTDKQSQYRWAM
jgi:hypothetical protein